MDWFVKMAIDMNLRQRGMHIRIEPGTTNGTVYQVADILGEHVYFQGTFVECYISALLN